MSNTLYSALGIRRSPVTPGRVKGDATGGHFDRGVEARVLGGTNPMRLPKEQSLRWAHNNNHRENKAMSKGQSLQDPFLNTLRKERVPVSIFLVNGIKLQGQIESFDQFVVLLKNSVSQMVYKHAISTVVPARNIKLPRAEDVVDEG